MGTIDFTRIDNMIDKAKAMSLDKAWIFAVDKEVQNEILRINTEEQLDEQGVDSLGRSLGDYSPFTVSMKKFKGDRYDHITLNDEGDFHNSFTVRVVADGWIQDADDSSKYDEPLFEVYGLDVLGITDENLKYIQEMIIENFIKYVRTKLLS
jgi:hypothetical protein